MITRISMLKYSLAIFFLICLRAGAQELSVTVNNTNFTVSTPAQMGAGFTQQSAFSVAVESNNKNYSLFAAVTGKSLNPSSAPFTQVPFSITLRSVSGGGSVSDHVTGDIQLTESPSYATLANNAPPTGKNRYYTLNYDINLLPLSYSIPPGNYIFTVTVQFTDGKKTLVQNFNISLSVQSILGFSLVQNQPTTVNFNSSSEYVNGVTVSSFHSSQVRSNTPWVLSVAAASAFLTPGSAGASTNMPCSVVGIRPSGASGFTQLSTSPATLRTGTAGDVNVGTNTTNYDMSFAPGWNYNPGIYNLSITYTVSSQ